MSNRTTGRDRLEHNAEHRLHRQLRVYGFNLVKSQASNPSDITYGKYKVAADGLAVEGDEGPGFMFDLDEVDDFINGLELPGLNIVDRKIFTAACEIDHFKTQIKYASPHRVDRILDRLQVHIRERDHLLSLNGDQRAKAHELSQELDRFEFPDPRPDDATMNAYTAILDQFVAIVEVKA